MEKKHMISLAVSFGLLAALIYLSDFKKVVETFLRADPLFVAAGIGLCVLGIGFRTLRWRLLLRRIGMHVPFIKTLQVLTAGLFISNLTPAKAGDPVRSLLLKRSTGKSFGKSLPSIFVEHIFDVLALLTMCFIGFVFFTSAMARYMVPAIGFYAVLFIVFAWVAGSAGRTKSVIAWFHGRFSFIHKIRKLKPEVEKFSINLHHSFMRYKSSKSILSATFILSLIIWSLDSSILYVAFLALGVESSLVACLIAVPIAALIGTISLLPGGLGSSELVMVLFFTSTFPLLAAAEVLAAILLSRLMSFWVVNLVGSVFLGTKLK